MQKQTDIRRARFLLQASNLYRALERSTAVFGEGPSVRWERRLRGWLEYKRLKRADVAIVSFGKSGRTWLRVMLSRAYAQRLGLQGQELLKFNGGDGAPAILFTHDNYLGDFSGNRANKSDYRDTKVVLLVRDPADTAVSQYFQWRFRMRDHKKRINAYPKMAAEPMALFEFVMSDAAGLPKIFRYMNEWAEALPQLPHCMIVRYEDLRTDTAVWLERICGFMGSSMPPPVITDAVEFARLENMRQREADGSTQSPRLRAADTANPDSFKTRRAKVGGYRDYFSDDQVAAIDAAINAGLSDTYGYHRH